jgi:hypothetical protein
LTKKVLSKAEIDVEEAITARIRSVSDPEIEAVRTDIARESDRGSALLVHSFLDELLNRLLKSRLVEGSTLPALLFQKKVDLCFSVGVLTDIEKHDLLVINNIRNKIAHNYPHETFSSESVVKLCSNFSIIKILSTAGTIFSKNTSRELYEFAGIFLHFILKDKLLYIDPIKKCDRPRGFNK